MAKKTFTLEGFEVGQYMSWFVTSQAANHIRVKLYDSTGTVYFEGRKSSVYIEPPIAQGSRTITGPGVKLEVESEEAEVLETWINNMQISSASNGKRVGNCFVLAGEDQNDEDYNDIYVNITAWNKAH